LDPRATDHEDATADLSPARLCFGWPLEVNSGRQGSSSTRAATREGRRLDLSAKELAVLEALLTASPGRSAQNASWSKRGMRTPTRSPTPAIVWSPA